MKIRDVMSSNPQCCASDDTLFRAAELMWKHDLGALPVLDGDDTPIGIITDRDIAMASYRNNLSLGRLRVSECMSPNFWSIHGDDSISAAEKIMSDHRVHRLPVVEDGSIVGMVTVSDIARALLPEAKKVAATDLMQTISRVSYPRASSRSMEH